MHDRVSVNDSWVFTSPFVSFAVHCPAGEWQEGDDEVCTPCEIGYFKDNDVPGNVCVQCPGGRATDDTGSTVEDDCTHGKKIKRRSSLQDTVYKTNLECKPVFCEVVSMILMFGQDKENFKYLSKM